MHAAHAGFKMEHNGVMITPCGKEYTSRADTYRVDA